MIKEEYKPRIIDDTIDRHLKKLVPFVLKDQNGVVRHRLLLFIVTVLFIWVIQVAISKIEI